MQIEGVALQRRERRELEHVLVGCLEHDVGRLARLPRLHPAQHVQAPAVAGLEAAEAQLRARRAEVVSAAARELEKVRRDPDADQVRDAVLAVRGAAPVAEIAGDRVEAARPQRAAEDVLLVGNLLTHCLILRDS